MAAKQELSLEAAVKSIPWLEPNAFARIVHEQAKCSVKEFRVRRYEEQREAAKKARSSKRRKEEK